MDAAKKTKKRKRKTTRKGTKKDRINSLFRAGGSLYRKKRIDYPIREVNMEDGTYDLKTYIKGDTNKEEAFTLALVRTLGWPDQAPADAKVDALYIDLRLVFECDETQHFDFDSFFNRQKPGYQAERDRRINEHYMRQGYYVVRVRAADLGIPAKSKDGRLVWQPTDNRIVTERTIAAVRAVTALRRENMSQRNDFNGHLIVYPDLSDQHYAKTIFNVESIDAALRTSASLLPLMPEDHKSGRDVLEAQDRAMQAADARNLAQMIRDEAKLENAASGDVDGEEEDEEGANADGSEDVNDDEEEEESASKVAKTPTATSAITAYGLLSGTDDIIWHH